jgi:hypothetical protein
MAFWWQIQLPVRYAYKRGMVGTDIAALQLNLGAHVDGDFGRATEDVVKQYQADESLLSDGIAGGKTMQRLCVQRSFQAYETHKLPKGLLKSFMSSESSFIIGSVSKHPNDQGWDVGPYQLSSGLANPPSQVQFKDAYEISVAADITGAKARVLHDGFPNPVQSRYLTDLAADDKNLFKWQMVALNHNWPYAAHWIPRRGHIYDDPSRDDQWTEWISNVTNGRLSTPRQWVAHQVETKTVYLEL